MIYPNAKRDLQSTPRHDIDPELKLMPEWHKEVANYIYNYHPGSWLATRQEEFVELRAYAHGNQDTDKYQSIFMGKSNSAYNNGSGTTYGPTDNSTEFYDMTDHRMGFANIDFTQIFSPAPNMISTLQGIMESQKHAIRVAAIDENSNNERKAIEYRMIAQMQFKEMYDAFAAVLGGQEDAPLPSSMEELKMYGMLGGFMLPYETGIQEIVDYHFKHESIGDDLQEKIINDFAAIGMSAAVDSVDPYSQRATIDYIDLYDCIVHYNQDNLRFKDSEFWAHQKYMTIYELRTKSGWDEKKIQGIASRYINNTTLGNPNITIDSEDVYSNTGNCNYNDFRVPVLYYEFLTVDSKYYTNVKGEEGQFTVEEPYRKGGKGLPRVHNKEKRKTTRDDLHTWYCGYWVMDENDVFGYGKKLDQPFDTTTREPRCSLHIYCLPGPSLIKQSKPILDDIQMLYLRYQNDKATAPPTYGIAVDIGALNEMKIGNKKLHPFDTMKIRFQSGTQFYLHGAPVPGKMQSFNQTNGLPFQDLPGGIGRAIADFVAGITNAYNQLAIMSGIDRITMGSFTPSSETTATQIKTAMANTKDTLKLLYTGFVRIKTSLARNIAIQAQQLIVVNEKSGYDGIISKAKLDAIKVAGKTPPAEYGLEMIMLPSSDEVAVILDSARAATQGGKNGIPALSYSEYLFIFDALKVGRPMQHVMAYIAYKEKMRDQQAAETAMRAQEMDTQKSLAINKEKISGELAIEDAKSQGALKQIIAKGMIDLAVQQRKGEDELKKLALDLGVKVGETMNQQPTGQPSGPPTEQPMNQQTPEPVPPPMQ
jgi:hypothetical protein